jgi:hypothetical protein
MMEGSMKSFITTVGLAVCAGAIAIGCASTPVPKAKLASTQSAVQNARGSGADRVPGANTQLTMAEDQLGRAEKRIGEGDNKEADRLLTRAEADAALATSLARESQQQQQTQASVARARSMATSMSSEQMQMGTPSGR